MSYWFWRVYCPCGYASAWHKYFWLAKVISYLHAFVSRHKRGAMTIAACDVGKIEAQVSAMQAGGTTPRAVDVAVRCKKCGNIASFHPRPGCSAFTPRN